MREIKFRGKRKDNKWFYGVYFNLGYAHKIVDSFYNEVDNKHEFTYNDVIEETAGQFTGLKDKNGVDIYENDVISRGDGNFIVKYKNDKYYVGYIASDENDTHYIHLWYDNIEVIGNIHQ